MMQKERIEHSDKVVVAYRISVYPGNRKLSSAWAKRVESICPKAKGGYAIVGAFLKTDRHNNGLYVVEGAAYEGAHVVVCGRGGSWSHESITYALFQIERDAEGCLDHKYQQFDSHGARLIASSASHVVGQEAIDEYPVLMPAVGTSILPLLAALCQAGYPATDPPSG
jgi:hypothetical protein